MSNPNCGNNKCLQSDGEVRVLPTGGDSNAILCQPCFHHEMRFRRTRNLDLGKDARFDIPEWESLKVYGEEAQ